MSESNGVVRISRKGKKKFAFGEEGPVFETDVVTTFQEWVEIDDSMRGEEREILDITAYHERALLFARKASGYDPQNLALITTAEALDFLARLREVYDDLANFFRPRSLEERGLPSSSVETSANTLGQTEMQFSVEES